jgi:hypothetical protein
MELLIFQTDIKSKGKVKSITPILNHHSAIIKWSVDLEDIDNILRIEAKTGLKEKEVIDIIKEKGFYIEPLLD